MVDAGVHQDNIADDALFGGVVASQGISLQPHLSIYRPDKS